MQSQTFCFDQLQWNLHLRGLPVQISGPFDFLGKWGLPLLGTWAPCRPLHVQIYCHTKATSADFSLRASPLASGIQRHLFCIACCFLYFFHFNDPIKISFEYFSPFPLIPLFALFVYPRLSYSYPYNSSAFHSFNRYLLNACYMLPYTQPQGGMQGKTRRVGSLFPWSFHFSVEDKQISE